MAYETKQITRSTGGVRTVTLKTIMKSAAFRKGFDEAKKNLPFDYDYVDRNLGDAWRYERGRLLGFIYKGKLKEGKAVTNAAITAYKAARADRLIF